MHTNIHSLALSLNLTSHTSTHIPTGVGVSTLVSYSKYGAAMVGEVKTLNDLDKLDHDWWFISC